MPHIPLVPEDAPFNAEQRAWLNNLFSQMTLGQGKESRVPASQLPVTILWGSQTGNALICAKKMAKALPTGQFETTVVNLADYEVGDLAKETYVLLITSTYGDGEPPDNAVDFHEKLMGDEAPKLDGVKFAVFGLGDTDYPDFCQCAVDFDVRMAALGGEQILDRVDADVEYNADFAKWRKQIVESLGGGGFSTTIASGFFDFPEDEEDSEKDSLFPAPILTKRNLNCETSLRETYHLELSLDGSGFEYEAGDALGVMPENPEDAVDEILENLPFHVEGEVPLPSGGEPLLRDALCRSYDIRSLSAKFVQTWQKRSGSPFLRALVESGDKAAMAEFLLGRELIDLLIDHPADFSDGEEFVSILKKLQPRLYSIASSPNAHPNEVHLTVAVVRYQSHGRERRGVCSTYLADRTADKNPRIHIHQNQAFRIPENPDVPMIMVGPGTGVAPFRAFLEERRERKATGRNWLFFGNPHAETDFLYEEELMAMLEGGTLTRLDTAFSRDQPKKIYVQDRMIQQAEELWKCLEEGAYFYVCGDASRMAKDVDAALHQVIQEQGKLSLAEATDYVKKLRKEKRYVRDIY